MRNVFLILILCLFLGFFIYVVVVAIPDSFRADNERLYQENIEKIEEFEKEEALKKEIKELEEKDYDLMSKDEKITYLELKNKQLEEDNESLKGERSSKFF